MPVLRDLDADEKYALLHLLQNRRSAQDRVDFQGNIIESLTDNALEEKLAKLSEESHHALKNRYRHQRRTMDYADPKRMPIDEAKVRDLLRNQHLFRGKMDEEVGTYSKLQLNPQIEHGVLTYVKEAAWGDMKALLEDVGITKNTVEFFNLAASR